MVGGLKLGESKGLEEKKKEECVHAGTRQCHILGTGEAALPAGE